MSDRPQPSLRPLHGDESLIRSKLEMFEKLSSAEITRSLAPGQPGCLKTRPDGTVLGGHHRLFVLRRRGVNVELLPRTIVERE